MNIHVHLHGALRDKLPPNAKGRATLQFEEGAMASSVVAQLSLRGHVEIALNQELIENDDTILHDGDTLEIFRPAAGGEMNRFAPEAFEPLDEEEKELMASIERGEWQPVKNFEQEKAAAVKAAHNTIKKMNADYPPHKKGEKKCLTDFMEKFYTLI